MISGRLQRLITRREKPEHFHQALERAPDDIKVVIQYAEATRRTAAGDVKMRTGVA
ncbi:MAG TPA: hypothetical protein VFA43_13650 [Gemmatimonadaceae bacterium]|nr:hypothetical protein [Gemmatimonadaceae bacterium]